MGSGLLCDLLLFVISGYGAGFLDGQSNFLHIFGDVVSPLFSGSVAPFIELVFRARGALTVSGFCSFGTHGQTIKVPIVVEHSNTS